MDAKTNFQQAIPQRALYDGIAGGGRQVRQHGYEAVIALAGLVSRVMAAAKSLFVCALIAVSSSSSPIVERLLRARALPRLSGKAMGAWSPDVLFIVTFAPPGRLIKLRSLRTSKGKTCRGPLLKPAGGDFITDTVMRAL